MKIKSLQACKAFLRKGEGFFICETPMCEAKQLRLSNMMEDKNIKIVMDNDGIDRCLTRIAYEILEKNKGKENLVLVGIRTGGVYLAERLQKKISGIEAGKIPLGILDITLYRDDISTSNKKPRLGKTKIPFSLDDKIVVLLTMCSLPGGPFVRQWTL